MEGPVSRQSKDDLLYKELLHDWLWLNRREALWLGAGALTYFQSVFDRAYADAEFQIDASPQNSSKSSAGNVEVSQTSNSAIASSAEEKMERPEVKEDIEVNLGTAYRAPMCGLQNLTATQFRATATPEKIPDSVAPGSFFSDASSRKFLSGGESPLATALRSTATTEANPKGSNRVADRANNSAGLQLNQTVSTAAGTVAKIAGSVDWSELPSAMAEKTIDTAIDFAKGKAVEKVLTSVVGGPAATAYNLISLTIDVIKPTTINRWNAGPELTGFDRLSPSEKREFRELFQESWRESLIPREMPPEGPALRRPY